MSTAASTPWEERLIAQLVEHGQIGELPSLLRKLEEKRSEEPLPLFLTRNLGVKEELVYEALARFYHLPFVHDLRPSEEVRDATRKVPLSFLRTHLLLPLEFSGERMVVAAAHPDDLEALEYLEHSLNRKAIVKVTTPAKILALLNEIFGEAGETAEEVILELKEEEGERDLEGEPLDLLEETDAEAPIIRLVNRLFSQAVRDRASDIHIEPFEQELVIRYRIDGVLYPILRPPKRLQPAITSRVKIMAGLNIAEKRLPQDGRIRLRVAGRDIDVRVSTLPTTYGERVVLRLLDRSQVILRLEELGFTPEILHAWRGFIHRPYGILLVTGPTGSGKTTTLYASLSQLNHPDRNIITIEDPVEYQLKGIGQINVNPKIGLTFAHGLRTILRQDPDIILVGEIRDLETAEIAIQASLTGHLVFSTLHTNDAPSAVTRLVDMGVEPFLVSSSLLGVLAQRLVRTLCPHCKVPVVPTREALKELGIVETDLPRGVVYEGRGCPQCKGTGYRGRIAIGELMRISDPIRQLILKNQDAATIRKTAQKLGMKTLREDGASKVIQGLTSIAEVLRVTQDEVVEE